MPDKVDNSPFNKTGADPLAEMNFGQGAVHIKECRLVVQRKPSVQVGEHTVGKLAFFGSCLTQKDLVGGDNHNQMWECEVVIIPKRKYREGFQGHRADQILCDDFSNPENWKEQIL